MTGSQARTYNSTVFTDLVEILALSENHEQEERAVRTILKTGKDVFRKGFCPSTAFNTLDDRVRDKVAGSADSNFPVHDHFFLDLKPSYFSTPLDVDVSAIYVELLPSLRSVFTRNNYAAALAAKSNVHLADLRWGREDVILVEESGPTNESVL